MKKTIMVGLTGHDAQYRLDEDAYERLSGYLDRAASIALALILPVGPPCSVPADTERAAQLAAVPRRCRGRQSSGRVRAAAMAVAASADPQPGSSGFQRPELGDLRPARRDELGVRVGVSNGDPSHPRALRSGERSRATAITALSTLVGAVSMARAVDDEALSREILALGGVRDEGTAPVLTLRAPRG